MTRVLPVGVGLALLLLAGCGRPDGPALQKLACEQVARSIDLQSVGQLDALRKALGVAPGVDPIQTCRDLGVPMQPRTQAERSDGNGPGGNPDDQPNENDNDAD
jgi:hypothetical protein